MLQLGGYFNIAIAAGHLIGLFWAEEMFAITGIGKEMKELATMNYSLPYVLTFIVTIFFFLFGLYGLSADGKFKKLPQLKIVIFTIAVVYLFRGLGELVYDTANATNTILETIYSLIAIMIGLLFLIGGYKKWGFQWSSK